MPVIATDRKYSEALDLGLLIVSNHGDETDVTENDVRGWPDYDLYEFLETWGHVWIMSAWEYAGFEEE